MSFSSDAEQNQNFSTAGEIQFSRIDDFSRNRLYELFGLIEKEFESLYAENLARKFKNFVSVIF